MSDFAPIEQILEIRSEIVQRDWRNLPEAKTVRRIAGVSTAIELALDENYNAAPSLIEGYSNSDPAGQRVNTILAACAADPKTTDEHRYIWKPVTPESATGMLSFLSGLPLLSSDELWAKVDEAFPATSGKAAAAAPVELEDGIYRLPSNDTIYKVYKTQRGHQVAKRLVVEKSEDGEATVWFEYEGKRPLRSLSADMRMSYEEMQQFGAIYGVCCVCSKTLTDELSVRLGIGPVCGKREFGEEFKFKIKDLRAEIRNEGKQLRFDAAE